MKIPKLKHTKKQDLKQQKKISKKPVAQRTITMQKQTKLGSSESVQQSSSNLENYKTFFQYLLSNDDNKLVDEF
jgi:hypothetical protein